MCLTVILYNFIPTHTHKSHSSGNYIELLLALGGLGVEAHGLVSLTATLAGQQDTDNRHGPQTRTQPGPAAPDYLQHRRAREQQHSRKPSQEEARSGGRCSPNPPGPPLRGCSSVLMHYSSRGTQAGRQAGWLGGPGLFHLLHLCPKVALHAIMHY